MKTNTNYEKPVILFESFTLNQSIADSCGVTGGGNSLGTPSHWDKTTCGWSIGGTIILWATPGICNDIVADESEAPDGLCYNTPTPNMQIFSS